MKKIFVLETEKGMQLTTFRSDDEIVQLFRASIASELCFISPSRALYVKGINQKTYVIKMIGTVEKEKG